MPARTLLTKMAVAELFGVAPATIDNYIAKGMPWVKRPKVGGGRRWAFDRTAIEDWYDARNGGTPGRRLTGTLPAWTRCGWSDLLYILEVDDTGLERLVGAGLPFLVGGSFTKRRRAEWSFSLPHVTRWVKLYLEAGRRLPKVE